MIANVFTVGLWTLMSRLLGFAREILIAAALGAGPTAEAFLIAFSLPNMFRRILAEGAMNLAFVPMFSKMLDQEDQARSFARDAFAWMTAIFILLTVLATLGMPWLVWSMASGFSGDERFDLAVSYGRITFIYILFISLAALLSGMLNSLGKFAAAAAAPVMLNVLFIIAILMGMAAGWDIGLTLVITVPIAGIVQFAVVWIALVRLGWVVTPRLPRLTQDIKTLMIIALPAILTGGVSQINLLVGRNVASVNEGAIAWLSYADRLYQLPLGVIGIAMGVVLLPELSRRLKDNDTDGAQDAFSRAAEISLALTLPATAAFIAVPTALVSVLFERGQFTGTDTNATALALMIYAIGLPAFVLQKVLQPLYYARSDTTRPFRFAIWTMVINLVLAIGLQPFIGWIAAPVATTVAAWGNVLMLYVGAARMGQAAHLDTRFFKRLGPIVLSSALMGIGVYAAGLALEGWLNTATLRYLALLILIALGGLLYFPLAHITGGLRLRDIRKTVQR